MAALETKHAATNEYQRTNPHVIRYANKRFVHVRDRGFVSHFLAIPTRGILSYFSATVLPPRSSAITRCLELELIRPDTKYAISMYINCLKISDIYISVFFLFCVFFFVYSPRARGYFSFPRARAPPLGTSCNSTTIVDNIII